MSIFSKDPENTEAADLQRKLEMLNNMMDQEARAEQARRQILYNIGHCKYLPSHCLSGCCFIRIFSLTREERPRSIATLDAIHPCAITCANFSFLFNALNITNIDYNYRMFPLSMRFALAAIKSSLSFRLDELQIARQTNDGIFTYMISHLSIVRFHSILYFSIYLTSCRGCRAIRIVGYG